MQDHPQPTEPGRLTPRAQRTRLPPRGPPAVSWSQHLRYAGSPAHAAVARPVADAARALADIGADCFSGLPQTDRTAALAISWLGHSRATPESDVSRSFPRSRLLPAHAEVVEVRTALFGEPAGTFAYVVEPCAQPYGHRLLSAVDAAERGHAARTLLRPGFAVMFALNLAIGVHFGAMGMSVTAFVVERGAATTAPAVFAAGSVAGLLAGWLFGLRRWRAAPSAQLPLATAALAAGCPLLLLAGSPVQLAGAVVVVEGMIPPILVLFSVLTEARVHRAVLTQALTWLNSASAAGSAAAAAVAGRAVDTDGADGGFALTVGASLAMTVLAAGWWAASRRTTGGVSRPHVPS